MKKYTAEQIRNLALVGHGGAGKTSLAESLLFKTGGSSRRGRVEEGNTVSDYDPEEIRRKVSISTSIVPCEWKNHKLNLLDTPGFFDFEGEMREALRVAELALVVVRGKTGVEQGELLQYQGHCLDDKRHVGELRALLFCHGFHLLPEPD